MLAHHLIIILLGCALLFILVQRGFRSRINISDSLVYIIISFFLIFHGLISIAYSTGILANVDGEWAALILLFLPGALALERKEMQDKINKKSFITWSVSAFVLVALCLIVFTDSKLFPLIHDRVTPFAITYLIFAMIVFSDSRRLLLGISAIIWAVYFAQLPDLVASGVGVALGVSTIFIKLYPSKSQMLRNLGIDANDLIESITNPYVILDLSGKIVYANSDFLSLSGYDNEHLKGSDAIRFFEIPSNWRFKVLSAESANKLRCHLIANDGEKIPVQLWLTDIKRKGQDVHNLLCILHEERGRELMNRQLTIETRTVASLYETSKILSASLEMKDVLEAISKAAENLTGADSCIIFSLNDSTQKIKPIYATAEGFNTEIMNFEMAVGQGLTGAVIRDGKAMIQNYDDVDGIAMLVPGTPDEEEESLLSVPLLTKNKVLGALTLYKVRKIKFKEEDIKALTIFASQASAALEGSRLFMKLKESERIYKTSLNMAGVPILLVDSITGRISDVNEVAEKFFKYSKSEFASFYIWDLNPPAAMHVAKKLWQNVKRSGSESMPEIDYISKDGIMTPCSIGASIITADNSCFIQWIVRDISEYKRILERSGFIQTLFENLGEPVVITDTAGIVGFYNKSFSATFNIDNENISGKNILTVDLSILRTGIRELIWARLQGENHLVEELILNSGQQNAVSKMIVILPVYNEHGKLKNYIWFFISPIKNSELKDLNYSLIQ